MMDLITLQKKIKKLFPEYKITKQFGELTISLPSDHAIKVLKKLKTNRELDFDQLIDLAAVDYSEFKQTSFAKCRYAVVYNLLSIRNNVRLRLRAFLGNNNFPTIETATKIFPNSDWYEREAFDLFGLMFVDHPDLRRLLTDYGFVGHPFRKDFPMIGKVEVRYDPTLKRVIYEPVSIEERNNVPRLIRDEGIHRG